jgi:1-deoxy-D-xylulose-5-phosphate synthase
MSLLDSVDSPADLKKLDMSSLHGLAAEIRARILETITRNGGHLASNLGVVELTIALHWVFESPRDAIVWDVGHQCYAHKLLTGRRGSFEGIRRKGGISGFPKRAESEHDAFDTGHASTSISAALGLLEARRRRGERGKVVAVIGDGALTGGMAFEALSHAGQLGLPLVVILNDNKMSISPNVGGLSRYLSRLSATPIYQVFRSSVDSFVRHIPLIGGRLFNQMYRWKRAVKAVVYKDNLFSDLGFGYVGPIDGHDLHALVEVLEDVRAMRRPVVIHVLTRKGKGHDPAEDDPVGFHGVSPERRGEPEGPRRSSFTQAFGAAMVRKASEEKSLVAVTAAMAEGTGLAEFQRLFPDRIYDVGIAEEHAVTFSAGLAAGGLKPVVALYSTFAQRSVDQIFHDVALPGLPVVFALDRSGAVGEDGETHQGLFDISLFRSFPNLSILAPASSAEVGLFLSWALDSGKPAILRYPKARCPAEEPAYLSPLSLGRGVFVRRGGADCLLAAAGALVPVAIEASEALAATGRGADVYSLRFLAPFDEEAFLEAAAPYRTVLVLEDAAVSGGLGESVVARCSRRLPRVRFEAAGFPSLPFGQASRDELLASAALDAAGIADRVLALEAAAEGEPGIFFFRSAEARPQGASR